LSFGSGLLFLGHPV